MRHVIRNHYLPQWLSRIASGFSAALIVALLGLNWLSQPSGSWRHITSLCLLIMSIPVGITFPWLVHHLSIVLGYTTSPGSADARGQRRSLAADLGQHPFPADEFLAFIQERFPSARIERSSNDLGTVWIEVRAGARHAQIVTYADGTIGATDIARSDILYEDVSPFAPFGEALDSVQSAKDFMVRALSA